MQVILLDKVANLGVPGGLRLKVAAIARELVEQAAQHRKAVTPNKVVEPDGAKRFTYSAGFAGGSKEPAESASCARSDVRCFSCAC